MSDYPYFTECVVLFRGSPHTQTKCQKVECVGGCLIVKLLRFAGRLSQGTGQPSSCGLLGQSVITGTSWASKDINQPQDDRCFLVTADNSI